MKKKSKYTDRTREELSFMRIGALRSARNAGDLVLSDENAQIGYGEIRLDIE